MRDDVLPSDGRFQPNFNWLSVTTIIQQFSVRSNTASLIEIMHYSAPSIARCDIYLQAMAIIHMLSQSVELAAQL